jgi:uncharacterized membrane protein
MADLIVMKFDDTYGAQQALSAVRALQEMNYAWVDDIAVVEKHHSGRVTLHTPHGSVAGATLFGGLIGMLLFWWFPPAWFFGGWLGGMGIGALAGEAMKKAGVDQDMVDQIKSELTHGTSALVLMGAKGDADEMARAFEKYKPVSVIRHEMPEQTVANLKDALGDAEPPAS